MPDAPLRELRPGRSTRLALPWAVSTYFAEGLPYSLVHQILPQYLTSIDVSPEALGLTSLLHAPWNFKFLWSPLVERVSTSRTWLVSCQLVLAAFCVGAGALMEGRDVSGLMVLFVATAFVAATNDLAIDTFYLRAFDGETQTRLSGPRIGAYRAAMLIGSGPIVGLAGTYGFRFGLTVLGGILAGLALLHAVLLPKEIVPLRKARFSLANASEALRELLGQPSLGLALGLLLTYRAGDALLFAMNIKFLGHLGLDTAGRAMVNGTFGTAASIAGSMVGGGLMARFGFGRAFLPIACAQSGALLLYAALAASGLSTSGIEMSGRFALIFGTVVTEQFIAGVGTASFVVFLLRLADGTNKGIRFAVASSLMSVGATVAGSSSGFLYAALAPTQFFLLAFAASLPGLVFATVLIRRADAWLVR